MFRGLLVLLLGLVELDGNRNALSLKGNLNEINPCLMFGRPS